MTDHCRTRLTLVGTVHRDPRGRAKLERLLAELRPQALTLEMSRLAFSYRQTHARRLRRRLAAILAGLAAELGRDLAELRSQPAIADIRTLLEMPFEHLAAAAYARGTGIPLELIDSSEISAIKLKRVEGELITRRNLRVLVDLPEGAEKTAGEGFGTARLLVYGQLDETVRQAFLERHRGSEGIGRRDDWMAGEIRRRLHARPDLHLVHIGGWLHLVEDNQGETLFSRLQDLGPRRILLDDRMTGLEGRER